MATIPVTPTLSIDSRELDEQFIRASGPGGQNVNKVSSAVVLRFDAARCPTLPRPVFERLRTLAGRRMTADGVVVINANRFRDQARNRADALERLCALLRTAAEPPVPRVKTKPTRGARERRLEAKRQRSGVKRERQRRPGADD